VVGDLAYKPNVDDARESPACKLMAKLEAHGATVDYNDPHIPEIPMTREHPEYAGRRSVPVSDDYDLILIATAHRDYQAIDFSNFASPVVDTRNCLGDRKPGKYFKA